MQIEKAKRRDVATPFRWRTGTSAIWPVRLVGEFAIFVTRWP